MFLKSLLSFLLIYEVTDNKYNLPHQKLLGPGLQCSERKNALNSDADAPRPLQMRPSSHQQTDTQRPVLPSPEFPKQGPCEGSSPYFCWRMAAVPSRAQPGRMMPNFPGTDRSTTVEPRRHSGLWPSPIGPPSMTRDN